MNALSVGIRIPERYLRVSLATGLEYKNKEGYMSTTHKQDWTVSDMLTCVRKSLIETYEDINEKIELIRSGEYAVLTAEDLKTIQNALKAQILEQEKHLAE